MVQVALYQLPRLFLMHILVIKCFFVYEYLMSTLAEGVTGNSSFMQAMYNFVDSMFVAKKSKDYLLFYLY